jgi:tetratricopeptide (TPR) repeat protein
MELDDFEKASNYFKKAALHKSNKDFSPYYLNKYALALELKGDLKEAINAHDKIISEYRSSVLFQESQKQKARLEGLIVE